MPLSVTQMKRPRQQTPKSSAGVKQSINRREVVPAKFIYV
jgi:hypothetical protein